jgi:hypothetical protein
MTVYWPNGSTTRPRVSSPFDPARRNPVTGIVQPHNGDDLIGFVDNCSPVDGTVVFAGYNGGAGNEVRIRADGPTAFHVGDHYRILHHASLYVRTGQRVSARQPVGRMGTTGQSTGVHCHFETHEYRLWNPVNPSDYMARANAGTPAGGGSTPYNPEDEVLSADDKEWLRNCIQQERDSEQGRLANIHARVDQTWDEAHSAAFRIRGFDPNADMLQLILAGVNEAAGKDAPIVPFTAADLARELAPLVDLTAPEMTDDELDRVVTRLVDEQARRLAQ